MPDDPSPNLARLQQWFQAVITHPDGVRPGAAADEARRLIDVGPGGIDRLITRSDQLDATDRLNVYANAYFARLLECLGDVYPVLKRALGDDTFGGFAFGYLQQYPSRSYTLNELGRHFPQYLRETRPPRDDDAAEGEPDWPQFLIDLAELEWAVYDVFDGPGLEDRGSLSADDLKAMDPHAWPTARLEPAPCLRLLATAYPVNDFYTAVRASDEDETVDFPEPAESYVAVNRVAYGVRRHGLTKAQQALLCAVVCGEPVGEAIAAAADVYPGDADDLSGLLQQWFHDWTAGGFFAGVEAD